VVPSPTPKRIFEIRQIKWLLEHGCVVICAGGGGIPTMYRSGSQLVGVEAVIDKDHASGLLARDVGADYYVMATDTDAVYLDFKQPEQRAIVQAHPDALMEYAPQFPAGSMLPKVVAACDFARASGKRAAIGALKDIEGMLAGAAGTIISTEFDGLVAHRG
jgi:carbamate kinase